MSFHERDWYRPGVPKVDRFPLAGSARQSEVQKPPLDVRAMWVRESRARRRRRMLRWALLFAVLLVLVLKLVT